ncbi:MAG: hypothetical protein JRE43_11285 [Deltaproteobacteria bacterium]|nr:hypothetical protein [Deltaproteobacteria bacterium]MBW2542914.1 hypothetical protein [Deltaproteobacteria bacterium]
MYLAFVTTRPWYRGRMPRCLEAAAQHRVRLYTTGPAQIVADLISINRLRLI